ncbi:unnamed protein product [Gadus morhua 'NCC']
MEELEEVEEEVEFEVEQEEMERLKTGEVVEEVVEEEVKKEEADWRPWLTLTLKGFPLPPQAADALAGCHGSQRLGNVQLASYTNPAKLSPGNSN